MSWRWRLALSSPRLRSALRSELLAELARPADLGEPWPEAIAEAAKEHSSGAVRSALAEIAPRLAEGESLSQSLRGLETLEIDEYEEMEAASDLPKGVYDHPGRAYYERDE